MNRKLSPYHPLMNRKLNQEMMQLEETISQRSHGLSGKALSEICNMCFKVKVATTGALVCERCKKKTCIRCGKRDQVRLLCNLNSNFFTYLIGLRSSLKASYDDTTSDR